MKSIVLVGILMMGLVSPASAMTQQEVDQAAIEKAQAAIVEAEEFAKVGDYERAINSYGKACWEDKTLEAKLTPRILELIKLKNGEVEYKEPVLDYAPYEAYEEARLKKQEEEDLLFRAYSQNSMGEQQVVLCRRCGGTGKVWQGGGSVQSAASEPSGLSSSQREDFYNSSASIKTTHTSGGSVVCPICNGTGR